jgi:16S rRNA (cytidine1402-2'-O)-methyltransferase
LRGVDVVASEDTRRTSRLLKHLQLPFTKLISHHEHNWKNSAPEIVSMAQSGQSIALVSDAGTPGICDPGMQVEILTFSQCSFNT